MTSTRHASHVLMRSRWWLITWDDGCNGSCARGCNCASWAHNVMPKQYWPACLTAWAHTVVDELTIHYRTATTHLRRSAHISAVAFVTCHSGGGRPELKRIRDILIRILFRHLPPERWAMRNVLALPLAHVGNTGTVGNMSADRARVQHWRCDKASSPLPSRSPSGNPLYPGIPSTVNRPSTPSHPCLQPSFPLTPSHDRNPIVRSFHLYPFTSLSPARASTPPPIPIPSARWPSGLRRCVKVC